MLKYFELLLQLLEIDLDIDNYIEVAKYIESNPNKDYVFLHRHTFIFKSFLDFVNERIEVEKFIKIGDVDSKIPLYKKENDPVGFFDNLKNNPRYIEKLVNKIVILDRFVWNIYKTPDLVASFSDNNIELLIC